MPINYLRELWAQTAGATTIIAAAGLTMLCGAIGLGLDTAVWYTNSHQLQTMVESSALSAAQLLSDSSQTSTSITAVAENNAMLNGYSSGTDSISVAFSPSAPPNATSLTVTATRQLSRSFSALFLASNPSVTSSAGAGSVSTGASLGSACILVVDPSNAQTLLVNSSFSINAPQCEIDVASTNTTAAMINSNMPNIAEMCIAGRATLNGHTVNNLQQGCTVHSNVYKNALPVPTVGSCTVSNQNYSGTVNLSPGVYCGNFNFNGSGTVNFAPGLYIFKGAVWNINSGWTVKGTGVSIYLSDASSYIQLNSGVTASLTAPTSGTYANILLFEPDGLSTSSFAINGTSSSGHALQGLVYLPSRNLTFNSTYSGSADAFTMVVHQLIFDSNSPNTWSVTPAGSVGSGGGGTAVLTN